MTTYEVRSDDNPVSMPLGTSTVSRHRSGRAAFAAIDRERRAFSKSPYSRGGSYLQRIVVEITPDAETRITDDWTYDD